LQGGVPATIVAGGLFRFARNFSRFAFKLFARNFSRFAFKLGNGYADGGDSLFTLAAVFAAFAHGG